MNLEVSGSQKTFYKKIDFGVNRGCLFWDSIMEDGSARIFQDPSVIHENLADSDQVGPCEILFHIMDLRPIFWGHFNFVWRKLIKTDSYPKISPNFSIVQELMCRSC